MKKAFNHQNTEKMKNRGTENKRAYLGVFLIAVGGLWILERLDLIPQVWEDIFISWQMLLIGIGLFSLIGGNKTTGVILIMIGGFFLIDEVYSIPRELRQIGWPAIIIGIGVVMLITHRHRKGEPQIATENTNQGMDYFDDFVVFGGREVFVNSQSFLGGKTTSMFGGTEYDLRQAQLSVNGAVIDCVSIFGGCGFKVPPDWTIKNEVTAVFGAFTDKRGATFGQIVSNPSKTLIIRGFSAFGGVEIKHF
jgi:predicted membrane protein